MELAKCEEDQEQIQVAMTHLRKALALDDGKVYEERLQVALHRLQLRSELYTQPERPEDQAAMIIEQVRYMPDICAANTDFWSQGHNVIDGYLSYQSLTVITIRTASH